jgi:alkylation response protein AidB-like acyl-CoA dehydrogenase
MVCSFNLMASRATELQHAGRDRDVNTERLTVAIEIARQLAHKFAEGAAERDLKATFPREQLEQLRESGLMAFLVPRETGGAGGTFADAARIISTLAEGDPNVAQMLIVHYWGVGAVNEGVPQALQRELNHRVVAKELRWTNGFVELTTKSVQDYALTVTPNGNDWVLNGRKFYCTGSLGADEIYITCVVPETREVRLAFVPLDTPGVRVLDDWTGMGQKTTASGTTIFEKVVVPGSRVITNDFLYKPGTLLSGVFPQAMLAGLYVGIAKNALRDTVEYLRTRKRAWVHSGVERATEDPYVMLAVGQMETWVEGIDATLERALEVLALAEANPSVEARARAMVTISKAKALSTDLGLKVCDTLFQVCGATATLTKNNYDRHWRNLRTITLHDPVEYKYRLIGDYALNDRRPEVSTYT